MSVTSKTKPTFLISNSSEKQSIVFFHGRDSSKETFSTLFKNERLKNFKLIAIDLPGHGNSIISDKEIESIYESPESFVKSLDTCLFPDLIGENEKFVLLGHSMGARAALAFASKHPKQIAALVIEDMDFTKRDLLEWSKEDLKNFSQNQKSEENVYKVLKPFYNKEWVDRKIEHGMIQEQPDGSFFIGTNPKATMAAHRLLLRETQNKKQFEEFVASNANIHVILASKHSACKKGQKKWFETVLPSIGMTTIADSHHSVHNAQVDEFSSVLATIAQKAFEKSN